MCSSDLAVRRLGRSPAGAVFQTPAGASEHAPAVRDAPHVGAEEQIGREPDVGEEQEREELQVRVVRVALLEEDRERGNDDVHAQDSGFGSSRHASHCRTYVHTTGMFNARPVTHPHSARFAISNDLAKPSSLWGPLPRSQALFTAWTSVSFRRRSRLR